MKVVPSDFLGIKRTHYVRPSSFPLDLLLPTSVLAPITDQKCSPLPLITSFFFFGAFFSWRAFLVCFFFFVLLSPPSKPSTLPSLSFHGPPHLRGAQESCPQVVRPHRPLTLILPSSTPFLPFPQTTFSSFFFFFFLFSSFFHLPLSSPLIDFSWLLLRTLIPDKPSTSPLHHQTRHHLFAALSVPLPHPLSSASGKKKKKKIV